MKQHIEIKKWGVKILKIGFMLTILYLIVETLNEEEIENTIKKCVENFTLKSYILISTVLFLQFINWSIEAKKFKYILSRKKTIITFKQAIKSVYLGNATGILTPDRLGNFIGRTIGLNKISKTLIISSTTLGNYAQLVTTLTFATLSTLLLTQIETSIILPLISSKVLMIITLVIWVISILIFFNPKVIIKPLLKIKWLNKKRKNIEHLIGLKRNELLKILLYGITRYTIFIIQLHTTLITFELNITIIDTVIYAGILYLLTTIVPSPLLGNLGTREYISILLLGNYQNPTLVVIASVTIWMINIAIPALIGTAILFSIKNKDKV